MPVEQGDRPFTPRSVWSTGNGRNCSVVAERASALLNGKSRVSREAQARFREGLGVQLPGATRPPTEVDECPKRLLIGRRVRVTDPTQSRDLAAWPRAARRKWIIDVERS